MTAERPCSNCGEPVDPKQLVCLECGARVALKEHRSWANAPMAPLAAGLMVVIVLGAALFGFAVSELTRGGDGDDDAPAPAAQTQPAESGPAVVDGERQPTTSSQTEQEEAPPGETDATAPEETAPSEPTKSETDRGGVPRWPPSLTAHTVVLVTTGDRAGAVNVAREARRAGLEAGMLRTDPYDLGTGLWIVYAGRFETRGAAAREAAGLQDRYPGAYAQLVQRSQ